MVDIEPKLDCMRAMREDDVIGKLCSPLFGVGSSLEKNWLAELEAICQENIRCAAVDACERLTWGGSLAEFEFEVASILEPELIEHSRIDRGLQPHCSPVD